MSLGRRTEGSCRAAVTHAHSLSMDLTLPWTSVSRLRRQVIKDARNSFKEQAAEEGDEPE